MYCRKNEYIFRNPVDLLKFENKSEASVITLMMDKVWVFKQRATLRMLTVERKESR